MLYKIPAALSWFGPAPNVVLCWHGIITKYTARYHCDIIAIMITNTDTNAKFYTVVQDNICDTKCYNKN